jgi:heat shock protein HslJ
MIGLSCKTTKSTTKKNILELGSNFEVSKMEKSSIELKVKPTLLFNFEKNTVSGNAGCNNYSGVITKDGNQLKFTDIVATKMFCGNMKIEKEFMQKLATITSYDLNGNHFLLYNKAMELVITCEKPLK